MKEYVSIVIPVYKVEKYIVRCLKSIIRQSYNKIEIILVDDCGGDDSIVNALEFLNDNNWKCFTIVRHENNRGLSAARNSGVASASGEYIYFLDGDDEITPDCIYNLIEAFRCYGDVDMVMAGIIRRNGDKSSYYVKYPSIIISGTKNIAQRYIKKEIVWNAVSRLFKKSLWIDNGIFFYEGITSEDMLWNFQMLPYLKKIALIEDCSYIYYQTSDSIMTSATRNFEFAKDYIRIANITRDDVKNNPDKNYIRYYHYLKYVFIPNALLWHGYYGKSFYTLSKDLLRHKNHDFQKFMSWKLRILLLFPEFFILKSWILKFKVNNLCNVVKSKLKV